MPSPSSGQAGAQPRVFVVEDETLVALNLEDMLVDLGCAVLGPAMRLDVAERMIDEGLEADLAVLDVNLAGQPVFAVARMLSERGVPIVFATGYGRSGLPEEWQQHTVLQKPYSMEDVAEVLRIANRPT